MKRLIIPIFIAISIMLTNTGFAQEIPNGLRTFYISTTGNNSNSGTENQPWRTLNHATGRAEPGDVIVLRGGTYEHDTRIAIDRSGTQSNPIYIVNYPGEVPLLDFWEQDEQPGRDGIRLNGDYWRIMGVHLTGAGGNGFRIHGSNNIIERCVAFENRLTGFHLEDGSHNLIKNNDSYRNFNWRNRVGNMADGFAAKYEALGPGNVFYGNRAWQNSDDGFDFWRATSVITLENNWVFENGANIHNESDFEGGGNGFKLGGDHLAGDHIVKRNLAFNNTGKGFDHNNNRGALTLIHNTSYNNDRNYVFPNNPDNGQTVFQNNISHKSRVIAQTPSNALEQGNSWQAGNSINDNMFMSLDTELAKAPRQADGSLPELPLLRPVESSFFVNGGVNIGEPYHGSAPDMGAFEFVTGDIEIPELPSVYRGSSVLIDSLLVYETSNASNWNIRDNFSQGNTIFGDRDFTIASIPDVLAGTEWISTAMDSRSNTTLENYALFTAKEEGVVYIAHSDRVSPKPAWLSDFQQTDMKLYITESAEVEREMTVYQKSVESGEKLHLGTNSTDGTTTSLMYIVIIKDATTSAMSYDAIQEPDLDIYPNPFNPIANINFTVATSGIAEVGVYNINGALVKTLHNGSVDAGRHNVSFDGSSLSSGVYFVRFTTGNRVLQQKMILLK